MAEFKGKFSTSLITPVVRLSRYQDLAKPDFQNQEKTGDKKFAAVGFTVESPALQILLKAQEDLCIASFGEFTDKYKRPIQLGTMDNYPKAPELQGKWVIKSGTKENPERADLGIPKYYNTNSLPVDVAAIERGEIFYPGSYAKIVLKLFTFRKSKDLLGVSSILQGLIWIRDGERLGDVDPVTLAAQAADDKTDNDIADQLELAGLDVGSSHNDDESAPF